MPPLIVRVGISDQPGDTRHCMYLSRTYSCQARFLIGGGREGGLLVASQAYSLETAFLPQPSTNDPNPCLKPKPIAF